MNYWEIVWGALGGATVALAVVAFLSKTLVAHFFAKDLENYKSVLKAEHDKELEELKFENTKDVERIRVQLAEGKAERDARRDYEYEARKRLYQECEPLLFQIYELGENALHRVYSLARTARNGNLAPEETWLDRPGYYMASTIYNLLAPAAVFKLIQRRLTFIDLTVEPHIKAQYYLAKAIYLSFTDSFDLAEAHPTIPYNPDAPAWKELRKREPSQYWRQHLPVGRLDVAVEGLILRGSSGPERLRSFGEFEAEYYNPQSVLGQGFSIVTELFLDFHPRTRPVLWRVLISQAHIYKALPKASHGSLPSAGAGLVRPIHRDERNDFDWRSKPSEATDDQVLAEPFSASEEYLRYRLGAQFID